eukprot:347991-Prorocentrum_minimum.AAC.1
MSWDRLIWALSHGPEARIYYEGRCLIRALNGIYYKGDKTRVFKAGELGALNTPEALPLCSPCVQFPTFGPSLSGPSENIPARPASDWSVVRVYRYAGDALPPAAAAWRARGCGEPRGLGGGGGGGSGGVPAQRGGAGGARRPAIRGGHPRGGVPPGGADRRRVRGHARGGGGGAAEVARRGGAMRVGRRAPAQHPQRHGAGGGGGGDIAGRGCAGGG